MSNVTTITYQSLRPLAATASSNRRRVRVGIVCGYSSRNLIEGNPGIFNRIGMHVGVAGTIKFNCYAGVGNRIPLDRCNGRE